MSTRPSNPTLFDDSDDDSDGGVPLKVNAEYAKRFEHNKKREERHRLEEKFNQDNSANEEDGSSDDESEDEDGILALGGPIDDAFNRTLEALKKGESWIYDGKTSLYPPMDADATTENPSETKPKQDKPMYLKDYHRERIMRGDVGADDDEEDVPKTYAEEQGDLQRSIRDEIKAQLATAGGDSDESGDDFLKTKEKARNHAVAEADAEAEADTQGMHPSRSAKKQSRVAKQQPVELNIDEADKDPEAYLSNFLASRAWVLPDSSKQWQAFESDDDSDAADHDQWEAAFNLRFEDPNKSNELHKTYARDVAVMSVRRNDKSGRRRQRELKREKKEAEKRQLKEERARLRKLKLEEAEEKLCKVKEAAGLKRKTLKEEEWVKFFDDAWEDDKWEEAMRKTFGDKYYDQAEAHSGDDDTASGKKKVKKPKWDDDIDIKDIVSDFEEDVVRPHIVLSDAEQDTDLREDEDEDDDDDGEGPASKRQKTRKTDKRAKLAGQKAARKEHARLVGLVDAKMDIQEPEILMGSSVTKRPAKFAYRETWPESYGLTARDILMAPDSALNEYVGLKKLAHFRPADKKAKDKKRLGKKARLRKWRRETFGSEAEHDGPAFKLSEEAAEETRDPKAQVKADHKSKKRKRAGRKKGQSSA